MELCIIGTSDCWDEVDQALSELRLYSFQPEEFTT